MKILVIGASGVLGSAVTRELSARHEVISASRNGDVKVDVKDVESIRAMFKSVGEVDASSPPPAKCISAHSRT